MNRGEAVEKFYTSWKWRKCRKAYADYRGNLCERCLKKGVINAGSKDSPLETHHKIPLNDENVTDPKIALSWDNLELLCKKCHEEEKGRKPKRWSVAADGTVTL